MSESPEPRRGGIGKFFKQLYLQVLLGIFAGIALGLVAPAVAIKMKPLADGFITILKMLLAPIIFFTVVHGLAGVRDLRKLGRLGTKAIIYFEVVSTLGLLLGFALVNMFKPGVGLHAAGLVASSAASSSIASAKAVAVNFTVVNFILSIIPSTMVGAFASGDILPVLFVSVLVGIAASLTLKKDSVLLKGVAEGQALVFRILGFVMFLAPIGAFGAMAATVGANGGSTLLYLARLVGLFYASCVFFVLVVFGAICLYTKISIFKVLQLIKDEIVLVLGTASGEVVFPRLVQKLERAGCDEAVVGLVLPAGYNLNLDGTAIYMAMAVGFIAQATDTPFSLTEQLAVLLVLLLTSKGGTTVAGGAFVKLAATLQSVRVLPLNGLALLFGVDRLMATAIATTNVIGNVVAVLAIAKSENALDHIRFEDCLRLGPAKPAIVLSTPANGRT
jgi:aerobic C4-dicarboxylate transport protein